MLNRPEPFFAADARPTAASPSSPSPRSSRSPASGGCAGTDPDRVSRREGTSNWRSSCPGHPSTAASRRSSCRRAGRRTLDFLNGAGTFFALWSEGRHPLHQQVARPLHPSSRLRSAVARLDRLIQVMHEQRADALQLTVGKPAALVTSGAARAITKDPLTDGADPRAGPGDRVGRGGRRAGRRRDRSRSAITRRAARCGWRSRPGRGGVARGGTPGPAATGPSAPARRRPRPGGGPGRDGRACSGSWWSSGASDLHLRSGEPPILRRHGELVREESAPISGRAAGDDARQHHVARRSGEFREGGDTDWAYEIEGLARFRCNAGRDRHGPIGRLPGHPDARCATRRRAWG